MYKTETHLHTSEVSTCAKLSAGEMIALYKNAGYHTVFVADHCKKGFFEKLGDLPWEEKTARFFSGYEAAKAAGTALGVTVLPSTELAFPESINHYLVYGITKEFMNEHPDFLDNGIEGFYPLAKKCGFLVIQAHPFRDGKCFPTPEFIDGAEIYNSNPRHSDFSEKSEALAEAHGLLVSSGSDAHRTEDVGLAGIETEFPIESIADFIAAVRSGDIKIIRHKNISQN